MQSSFEGISPPSTGFSFQWEVLTNRGHSELIDNLYDLMDEDQEVEEILYLLLEEVDCESAASQKDQLISQQREDGS